MALGSLVWIGGVAVARSPVETETFRVQFPGPPRPIRHPLPWGDRAIEVQGYQWESAHLALGMTYIDLPQGLEPLARQSPGPMRSGQSGAGPEPMDGMVRGWLERLGPAGAVESWPTWGGNGQRITGTTGAGLAVEARLVRLGDRVYILTALAAPEVRADAATAIAIQQFFESFEPQMAPLGR
ncbi:MAG: hypothetical protein Fur0042_10200 [Cyanophyceae cyanobacterium]